MVWQLHQLLELLNLTHQFLRGQPLGVLESFAPLIDLVLAADCVYFEPAFPLLVQTLRDLHAANPSAEFLFCYKKRRKVCRHAQSTPFKPKPGPDYLHRPTNAFSFC